MKEIQDLKHKIGKKLEQKLDPKANQAEILRKEAKFLDQLAAWTDDEKKRMNEVQFKNFDEKQQESYQNLTFDKFLNNNLGVVI